MKKTKTRTVIQSKHKCRGVLANGSYCTKPTRHGKLGFCKACEHRNQSKRLCMRDEGHFSSANVTEPD